MVAEPPETPDSGDIDDDALAQIEEKLNQLEEASRAVGRKDWLFIFCGATSVLIVDYLVPPKSVESPLGLALAGLGVVAIAAAVFLYWRRQQQREAAPPDPDAPLHQRIDDISRTLTLSATNLSLAAGLISDLQKEVTSRAHALDTLRREIEDNEERAKLSREASRAVDDLVDAVVKSSERRMRQVGWRQGFTFAIIGFAAATLLAIFSHLLPTIR